jgi:hypothetical protein
LDITKRKNNQNANNMIVAKHKNQLEQQIIIIKLKKKRKIMRVSTLDPKS